MKPLDTGTLAFLICCTVIGNDLFADTQIPAPTFAASQVVDPQHAAPPAESALAHAPAAANAQITDSTPPEFPIIDPHGFSLDFRPQIWMPWSGAGSTKASAISSLTAAAPGKPLPPRP
jgi:hypothetical protein